MAGDTGISAAWLKGAWNGSEVPGVRIEFRVRWCPVSGGSRSGFCRDGGVAADVGRRRAVGWCAASVDGDGGDVGEAGIGDGAG